MKKRVLLLMLFAGIIYANNLQIKFKELFTIGNNKLILGNVKSLAEDRDGNLYIPDSKTRKIYKVSPEGKLILEFGKKGVGPGDIRALHNISISNKNEIVISELAIYVSFFDINGKFLRKHTLNQNGQNGIWYLKYIGNNLVIGKKFIINTPTLMLLKLSKDTKIINNKLLEGNEIPVFNRQIRFYRKEFVPGLIYSNSKKYSAIAISNEYNIKILNNNGVIINEIKRNIKKPLLSKKEITYVIENDIKPLNIPNKYKIGFKSIIPLK
jgi:hypothetical protein